MKVVLFCGGLGMRLRDHTQNIPKPLAMIGTRPIIWHLMSYYAHHGHKDFILCLGYRGDAFKRYFLDYDETASNDFVLRNGCLDIDLDSRDIDDWTIRFVDTGLQSNIGMRLKAVQKHLAGEEIFLANYSDGLSDLPMAEYIDEFRRSDRVASFVSVRPTMGFHFVSAKADGTVTSMKSVEEADQRINGGFFILRNEIFDYLGEGEELVVEPFQRLIAKSKLHAYRYDGFWQCMDTFKDKQCLEDLMDRDAAPWQVWKNAGRLA